MSNTVRQIQAFSNQVKYLFTVLLLLCSTAAIAQTNNADTLHWSKDRKLTWDDFQGVPDSTSPGAAGTVSGFVTKSKYTSDTTISVVISAIFYKQKSWVKNEWRDSATLNHEKGHFNITEVFARKANIAFKQYKLNKATVDNDINRIFGVFLKEKNAAQDLYDKETTKPINDKKQKEWDKKITVWLKKYPV